MKQITLLFAVMLAFGLSTAQAQSPSCAKKCAKAKTTASVDKASAEAAAKLASSDESIEQKVCQYSGAVSYVRTVELEGGETKTERVTYNAEKGAFVSLDATDGKKSCSTSKACCKKKATSVEKERSPAKKSST